MTRFAPLGRTYATHLLSRQWRRYVTRYPLIRCREPYSHSIPAAQTRPPVASLTTRAGMNAIKVLGPPSEEDGPNT